MDFQALLKSITPDVYDNLKTAVEIGRWPDGRQLTAEQQGLCLQAIISYENEHLPPEQRTGYIEQKAHTHCGSDGDENSEQPIKWQ
ncbi:YeaC family protein [Aurantivibrio plasticivorans]